MDALRLSDEFSSWLDDLRDERAKAAILRRLEQLARGHAGDVKVVAKGLRELRIHQGPGYRIYFARAGRAMIVVLGGGDKSTQSRDIATALAAASRIKTG